tara:strand:- start:2000 stop:2554 length:555 start_codon:yes stop_codon:yes gene_type:complete
MTFEEKIINNCQIRQKKLLRPALIAHKKPDTGVTIVKKGAYFLIKDCADVTVKYLPHLGYSAYANPINELKGAFTQAEIIDFVGRSKEEAHTRQLLHIILTDIGCAQYKAAIAVDDPKPVEGSTVAIPVHDYTINDDDDDVYGDYDTDDDIVEPQPVVVEAKEEVNVDDVTSVINKLIEVFQAK